MKDDVFVRVLKGNRREWMLVIPSMWSSALSGLRSNNLSNQYVVEVTGEIDEVDVVYGYANEDRVFYNKDAILKYLNLYYKGIYKLFSPNSDLYVRIIGFEYNPNGLLVVIDDQAQGCVRTVFKQEISLEGGVDNAVLNDIHFLMRATVHRRWE